MEKLTCEECGTNFNCGAAPGKDHCWCMELPNLRQNFDLAGKCVCPRLHDPWHRKANDKSAQGQAQATAEFGGSCRALATQWG